MVVGTGGQKDVDAIAAENERLRAEIGELQRRVDHLTTAQAVASMGSFERGRVADGGPMFWSEQLFRICGLEPRPDGTPERSMFDMVHPDDHGLTMDRCLEAMRSQSRFEIEHRIVRQDGQVRWVHTLAHPVSDESGRLSRWVGMVHDVTVRKQTEQALRDTDDALRSIHAIVAHPDLTLSDRLRAFLRLGIERFQLPVGLITRAREGGHEVVEAVMPPGFPLEWTWPDDTPPHQPAVHISVPVPYANQVYGLLSFSGPGTRRRAPSSTDEAIVKLMAQCVGGLLWRETTLEALVRAEREAQHAHKLEALGRLAGGVAHEFNNLLMGIAGMAHIALGKLPEDSPARSYVMAIQRSVKSGASISRELLSFSRRRGGEAEAFRPDEVLARARAFLSPLLGETIVLDLQLGAPEAVVWGDPSQLEQLVVNLVINARDAMRDGGSIVVATEEGDEAELRIMVSDTGTGMDASTVEKIFEPFFTTKEVGEGTGLGLSVAYGIVKRMGGDIRVDSSVGQGTRFTVALPRVAARPEAKELTAPGLDGHGEETVLIVEDDPLVRLSVRHYLERHGYRVLEAASGPQALEVAARTRSIDLLLTDVMLPGLPGPRLAPEVQAKQPGARVLFMSASPAEELIAEGRISVGQLSLEKPFSERTLLAGVRLALSGPPIA